jgi:hypothetical protein
MRLIIATLAAAIALAGSARATPASIVYSESITTDGMLGATAFTNELVTLTFTADISNVTFFQGSGFTQYTNIPSLSTVTVAGIGTATFSDPISLSVFVFPAFSEFSVTDTALSTDVLDTFTVVSGFAGYNMAGPLSPVSGGAAYLLGTVFGTSLGDFEFTRSGGGVSTVSAVPEPPGLALVALGVVGLTAFRTRRGVRTPA